MPQQKLPNKIQVRSSFFSCALIAILLTLISFADALLPSAYPMAASNSTPSLQDGDEKNYIIKANGGVLIPKTSNWFASNTQTLAPGDTIVVPLDAEKIDQVILWRDMSQIFYQIALGAAAVGSL